MIAAYSQTMPMADAIRLTFTADNLCGVCEFVANARTRDGDGSAAGDLDRAPASDPAAKAKAPLALPPEHFLIFASAPAPQWPAEHLLADACARPAPPTEPPRAA